MELSVENIHVHYGRIAAVRGVSLRVSPGEIVCVVGPNGAGKSTTLLTVAGALKPTEGRVILNGRVISGLSPEKIAHRGVSFVPEGRRIFTNLTVDENLRLGTDRRRGRAQVEADLKVIFDSFPILRDRLHDSAAGLSGGEQQQLAIGRALMTAPQFLVVDEPSLGLAPRIVDLVYEILLRLRRTRGLTMLIVEQSLARAMTTADRVYVMRNGGVTLSGAVAELHDDNALERAYFGADHDVRVHRESADQQT